MLNKRTNILFDQELWNELTKLAKNSNRSVGELVRTAVSEHYELKDDIKKRIKKACDAIEANREKVDAKIDYKALINYGRKI